LYLLALASPTYPVEPEAWDAWTAGYRWGTFHGQEHLGFAPLFGHQYTHVWVDLRGIRDRTMAEHGLDYFENSRRAVLAQHAYALANPGGWTGYGPRLWGLTACDGPVSGTFTIGGRERTFQTYDARGASFTRVTDDGTVCPSAAAGSLPFAPELVVPLLVALVQDHGERIWGEYGFLDALNPTFTLDVPVQHGRVDPEHGWYDTDYLGIDQGPILAMIENHRSGLVWDTLRANPHLVRGLQLAGFSGGWLDTVPAAAP
ncbi:MAG: glucoamylase family protein, partial [Candidatus Krumholzibacteriia bacterium]